MENPVRFPSRSKLIKSSIFSLMYICLQLLHDRKGTKYLKTTVVRCFKVGQNDYQLPLTSIIQVCFWSLLSPATHIRYHLPPLNSSFFPLVPIVAASKGQNLKQWHLQEQPRSAWHATRLSILWIS